MTIILIYATILFVILYFFVIYIQSRTMRPRIISTQERNASEELALNSLQDLENDKSRLTKDQIRAVLVELDLSRFVVELFDETENLQKYDFYDTFIPPHMIIDCNSMEQSVSDVDRYIPLFETMDDFLEVLAYDNVLKGFIRYCPVDTIPMADHDVLTWDGTFVGQILTWYEDGKSDDQILHICNLMGLKYAEQILKSIHSELGSRYTMQQIAIWEDQTIRKIGGYIK